jgi:hypothetical protein
MSKFRQQKKQRRKNRKLGVVFEQAANRLELEVRTTVA